ncbi:tape measure protein [Klebsiella oxytoca]|uniref:tape measure protein n=1 Tax=Klebsiella oxytoca TaxID=571 RepID=UPI001CC92B14|nr:tape measure protein [Klebsiella oxytoca]MBZ7280778.1 tape measure protein [Klebsiella oxytoca]MCW9477446.1 tape measure protein [Klebsiella oxytoca]MCW9493720.1 tape measure protein [Klebsiella oxytoca]
MAENAGGIYYDIEMDVRGLLTAQQRVNQRLDLMERGFDKTTRSIDTTERSMSSLSRVAVALTAALSVQQVAEYADAWATVNNKLSNSLRPSEQLADVTERVFNITQQTRSSLDATASLYARLERATRQYGTSADDLAKLTTIINQGFVVSGATAQEAENAIIQLSQGLASGALRGEEFNSVNEQGNRLIVALADSMGVSIGEMRNMAAQGKLTTDVVVNGLLSQGAVIGKEFANTTTTISQALQVAGNNITKFFGENSTVKTGAAIFNDSVITASENIEILSGALVAVAAIMGSRYVGALAMSTAAKIQDTAASIAQSKASAISAKDAEIEAAAKLRLAEVEKSATISALSLAEGRLATLRATNASVAAEVQLAEAQTAEIRTQIAQIQSEKALETQRLKAQISDQGRIATATRMAELRRAEATLTTQLARAESASQNARATAIAQAEAQVSTSRLAAADATATATAANARYIASQEAATVASRAASVAGGLLRGALGLIGGPAGVAMLAAAAIFYFWQKAQQAREEALRFADSLDRVNSSMKAMNNTQLRGTIADANESIRAQKDELSDLQAEVDALNARYRSFTPEAKAVAESMGQGADFTRQQAEVSDQLAQKSRDLANAQEKLARTQDTAAEASRTLTNNMLTSMGVHDGLIEKGSTLERVQGAVAKAFGLTADEINRANQAGQNFNPKALQISPPTAEGDKNILNLKEQNELLKIRDERTRAVRKAEMEQAKVTKNKNQIEEQGRLAGENYDLQKAEEARQEAQRKGEQQDKRSASSAESVAQKLTNLRQQSELAASSTQELSRDSAILRAQQSLGSAATQAQIQEAGQYAAKAWDAAAAARGVTEALKAMPEQAENKSYAESMQNLKAALNAGKIDLQEYNAATEQMEQQHQANLAKIRSQQVVNPTQQALAEVDPVQQLANQHAQELALIQQFEQQGVLAHQNALALKNAADTQYEQQRTAAQWEILSQQSLGYNMLTSAVDAFSGNASNAITGLLTGTMSAQEAMRSLGNTILNSVINSIVQVGVEALKNYILGQTLGAASVASSVGMAATTASAWAPAAALASLATLGTNAAPASAGITSTVGLASGLALAGARYNGGPVSAGSMYQVGEKGKPEIYQASTGKQYMIPGDNGKVISNKDMQSGSGVSVQVNVINQSTGATVQSADGYMQDGNAVVELLLTDIERGGPVSSQIQQTYGLNRKAQGAY